MQLQSCARAICDWRVCVILECGCIIIMMGRKDDGILLCLESVTLVRDLLEQKCSFKFVKISLDNGAYRVNLLPCNRSQKEGSFLGQSGLEPPRELPDMGRQVLAVCTLLLCAVTVSTAANTSTLTLAPGACSAFEFDNLNAKFSYTLSLGSISDASCASSVRVSKFYILDSCVNTRDNQIGLDSYKDITCSHASSSEQSVCQSVFSQGPSNALVSLANLTSGQTFDSDNVCANENKGFVYVQSNCSSSTQLSISFNQESYEGSGLCLNIAGHHLSGWAIAIIVVAIFVALLLASWVLWCCCCGSCCCL